MNHKPLLCFGLLLVSGCDTRPQTYENCILKHVKDAQTGAAVSAVHSACQRKFPKKVKLVDPFEKATKDEKTTKTITIKEAMTPPENSQED